MEASLYHKVLRIAALTLAIMLVFQSGLVSPLTRQLSDQTVSYLSAAVGATATIRPNEVNILTAQIASLEQELAAREGASLERNIAVGVGDSAPQSDRTTFILSVILFILLVLIILNYVMDFIRTQRTQLKHEQLA